MTGESEYQDVDGLARLLLDMLALTQPPAVPETYASIESVQLLHADLISLREFLYATANGDLSKPIPFKGYIAGTLKTLQANLRHITWQTKMVASGDFTQRVEFIGEFSQSFNAMVIQLDQTLTELTRKETELSEANETLRRLAITDPLTGLNNRRHFFELAEVEVSKALRYSRPVAVMMFDIDHFKHINDSYGHATGDKVLKMVADTTAKTVRSSDIPGRYGGEEFVVLLPETEMGVAFAAAQRLRGQIEAAAVHAGEHHVKATASFGVSDRVGHTRARSSEKILSQLIDTADQALYESKNAGRNRVTVYNHAQGPGSGG